MASNSGKNYQFAMKEQSVIGTPVSGSGATAYALLPSPGGKFQRVYINSNEDRPDGQSSASRLGVRSVPISISSEAKVAAHNLLWAAVLRTTSSSSMVPGTTRKAYTIAEDLLDIDKAFVAEWVRWTGFELNCPTDAMATIGFNGMGRNAQKAEGSEAPWFTSPTLSTNEPLCSVDGSILIDGTPVTGFTSISASGTRGGGVQATIGTDISEDVYDGSLKITGSVSVTTKDLDFMDYITDETSIQLAIDMSDPDGNSQRVTLGAVKFGEFGPALGGEAAMISSSQFTAGYDAGLGGMIKVETTLAS